ncbi:MAG: phenylalanine--tRNA ligase subunit beta [Chloroflexi bacterium]|nr:phenylalanine--tRNA ligase subunit beta [Chloroflexota bacterium]
MRVSLKWLKDYVDILTTPDDLARRMTMAGVEVGTIDRLGADWDRDKVFVAQVTALNPHPNADRLQVVNVDYGGGQTTVVAGAFNMRVGDKVPLALAGATVINPYEEDRPRVTIKRSKLRGVESNGMVCSERELGVSDDHSGIMILPADAPVGTPLADYLGDVVLELDIKGRWDCLGMLNVAQEVAALQRVQLDADSQQGPPDVVPVRLPQVEYPVVGPHVDDLVTIDIEDPDLCARYTGIVVRGIQVGPSPQWMQERLLAAGMRPINNIVDVTNYVLLEYNQPIHAFDYDKLRDRQGRTSIEGGKPAIIVRRARPGETIESLDEVHRDLTPEMLIIADGAGPVAIAGVMGGLDSEVTDTTANILIESANFNPVSVRRTARGLRIPSEAQRRFEKGLPPEQAVAAAQRVASLIRELAGGEIAPGIADCYPVQPSRAPIWITPAEARRLLGMTFSAQAMTHIFQALDFEVVAAPNDADTLLVTPRYQRTDVALPADLVEEVARIAGYDRVPMNMLRGAPPPHEVTPALYWEEVARDVLTAAGYDEVITYSLTNRRALLKLLPDEVAAQVAAGEQPRELPTGPSDDRQSTAVAAVNRALVPLTVPPVKVANPLSAEMDSLRTTAMISLLETLAANLKHLDTDVCIFEVGRIYLPREGDLPLERRVLTVAAGQWRTGQKWGSREELDFFDLKGAVEALLARMGIRDVAWLPAVHPTFHPGRTAVIEVADPDAPARERRSLKQAAAGIPVGILGEVQHEVRAHFGIDERCTLVSLDFDQLVALARSAGGSGYQPVSRFPPVVQDIAFTVDEDVPAAWAEALIRQAGKGMVVAVDLFDRYKGAPVPAGSSDSCGWDGVSASAGT